MSAWSHGKIAVQSNKEGSQYVREIKLVCIVLLGAVALAACGPITPPATKPAGPSSPASTVTGTVTYLVRSALPATAVIEVVLQDVSRADAPAETINTQRIEANGKQVPFPYALKYNPAADRSEAHLCGARDDQGRRPIAVYQHTALSRDHQRRADP